MGVFPLQLPSGGAFAVFLLDGQGAILDAGGAVEALCGFTGEALRARRMSDLEVFSSRGIDCSNPFSGAVGSRCIEFRHQCTDGLFRDLFLCSCGFSAPAGPLTAVVIHEVTLFRRQESLAAFRLDLFGRMEDEDAGKLLCRTLDEAERLSGSSLAFVYLFPGGPIPRQFHCSATSRSHPFCRQGIPSGSLLELPELWFASAGQDGVHLDNDGLSIRNGKRCGAGYAGISRELVVPLMQCGRAPFGVFVLANKEAPYHEGDASIALAAADIACAVVLGKHAAEIERHVDDELQQAQKLKLVGRFAGGVAHDFNNLLGIVIGCGESGLQKALQGGVAIEEFEALLRAARRAADLTGKLLAMAGKQDVVRSVEVFDDLVAALLPMLQRSVGRGVFLDFRPGSGRLRVFVDAAQIEQLLLGLCSNACDAMDGHGRLGVMTDRVAVSREMVEQGHCCKRQGCYLRLRVDDTGEGMDPAVLPHVFEPFFSTKEKPGAVGMGLSVVYGIVKQNGGFLECSSRRGAGTCVTCYFSEHVDAAGQGMGVWGPQASVADGYVMVVEEEEGLRELCCMLLLKEGYQVVAAVDGDDALLLAENRGAPALLLTDAVLGGMSGVALASRLRAVDAAMRVLYMSDYLADRMAAGEGDFWIEKPFSGRRLVEMVVRLLPFSPARGISRR